MLGADTVRFSGYLCPHVRYQVTTEEPWGVCHRYVINGRCDMCGPLSEVVFRP